MQKYQVCTMVTIYQIIINFLLDGRSGFRCDGECILCKNEMEKKLNANCI